MNWSQEKRVASHKEIAIIETGCKAEEGLAQRPTLLPLSESGPGPRAHQEVERNAGTHSDEGVPREEPRRTAIRGEERLLADVRWPAIVLFDIDGTLIDTGGAGARSWSSAFELLYGLKADIGEYTSAGETDPFVARKTFEAAIGRVPSSDELGRLYAAYLQHLSHELATTSGYRVLDGVESTLT